MLPRRQYLERLIIGLETSIPDFRDRLRFYAPDDLELKYARKFLAAMEESLEKARKELDSLSPGDGDA